MCVCWTLGQMLMGALKAVSFGSFEIGFCDDAYLKFRYAQCSIWEQSVA